MSYNTRAKILIDMTLLIRFRPEADTIPEAEIELLMSIVHEIIAEMAWLESGVPESGTPGVDWIKPAIALECPD